MNKQQLLEVNVKPLPGGARDEYIVTKVVSPRTVAARRRTTRIAARGGRGRSRGGRGGRGASMRGRSNNSGSTSSSSDSTSSSDFWSSSSSASSSSSFGGDGALHVIAAATKPPPPPIVVAAVADDRIKEVESENVVDVEQIKQANGGGGDRGAQSVTAPSVAVSSKSDSSESSGSQPRQQPVAPPSQPVEPSPLQFWSSYRPPQTAPQQPPPSRHTSPQRESQPKPAQSGTDAAPDADTDADPDAASGATDADGSTDSDHPDAVGVPVAARRPTERPSDVRAASQQTREWSIVHDFLQNFRDVIKQMLDGKKLLLSLDKTEQDRWDSYVNSRILQQTSEGQETINSRFVKAFSILIHDEFPAGEFVSDVNTVMEIKGDDAKNKALQELFIKYGDFFKEHVLELFGLHNGSQFPYIIVAILSRLLEVFENWKTIRESSVEYVLGLRSVTLSEVCGTQSFRQFIDENKDKLFDALFGGLSYVKQFDSAGFLGIGIVPGDQCYVEIIQKLSEIADNDEKSIIDQTKDMLKMRSVDAYPPAAPFSGDPVVVAAVPTAPAGPPTFERLAAVISNLLSGVFRQPDGAEDSVMRA